MRILPYREPDNTVSGALVTFVDLTSIVRAEEALVEADIRKDVFLATLSHELRNPLAPIRTAAEILTSPKLQPAQLGQAQDIIKRQVKNLSTLLDDLLDISRITRGSFPLRKGYVDVRKIFEEAVEIVQEAIAAKEHTLRIEWPDAPIIIEVDPMRITQSLTNLLTNAVKYTPPKGLLGLSVHLDGQFLTISVADNGMGLAPEHLSKVFEMFTRIQPSLNQSEGGLGIGLSLAQGFVQLHGGKIDVHSAGLGQGCVFSIKLPQSLIVRDPLTPTSSTSTGKGSSIPSRRILLADDNQDAASTLSIFLQMEGHETKVAYNGKQAFQIAREWHPDICLLDLGMPDLSGYEVAERLRNEAWGADMLLIAVTGWGQENDKRHAFLAGFDQHVTKPVEPEKLKSLLTKHSARAAPNSP